MIQNLLKKQNMNNLPPADLGSPWRSGPQGSGGGMLSAFLPNQQGMLANQLSQGFGGTPQQWKQSFGQIYSDMRMPVNDINGPVDPNDPNKDKNKPFKPNDKQLDQLRQYYQYVQDSQNPNIIDQIKDKLSPKMWNWFKDKLDNKETF